MKKDIWHSQYFKQIFFTLCLIMFPILLTALGILYISFYHATLSYLDSATFGLLSTEISDIRYQLDRANQNVLNAYSSADGVRLTMSTQLTEVERVSTMRDLQYFITQDPLIDSVYFFNAKTGEIYMFGSDLRHSTLDDFWDTDIVNWILNETPTESRAFPRTLLREYDYLPQPEVATNYYRMPNGNAVILNSSIEKLYAVLKNDTQSDIPVNYLVCYEEKQILYHNLSEEKLWDLDKEQFLSIINSHSQNTYSESIGGILYHFNTISDAKSGVQIISIMKQSDFSSQFSLYHLLFILVATVGCFLIIFSAVRFSTKIYSPIGQLKNMLPSDKKTDQTDNELDSIMKKLAQFFQHLDNLFEFKQKNLLLSQTALVEQQTLYHRNSAGEFWKQCAELDLPYHQGDCFTLILCTYHTKNGDKPLEPQLLCYAVQNVFQELFSEFLYVQIFPEKHNSLVICCWFRKNIQITVDFDKLARIQKVFDQYFQLVLSFFLSRSMDNPDLMYSAMTSLHDLSQYQYLYDETVGCILKEEDCNIEKLKCGICPMPDMLTAENALHSADMDIVNELIEQYCQTLLDYNYESISASVSIFGSRLISLLKKMEENCPGFPQIDYRQFFHSIVTAPSLKIMQKEIYSHLELVVAYYAEIDKESEKKLLDNILSYINQNFTDYALSSKAIASHYHISVSYLNRIFKQKTGENIPTYLKRLRLDQARQLLLTTTISVESIAQKVGFENTKYFYTLFRTEYGLSPSQYRLSSTLESSEITPPLV